MEEVKFSDKLYNYLKRLAIILFAIALLLWLYMKITFITTSNQISAITIESFDGNGLRKHSVATDTVMKIHTVISDEKDFLHSIKRTITNLQEKDFRLMGKSKNIRYLIITAQFLDTTVEETGLSANLQLEKIKYYDTEFNSMNELREMLNKYNEY